jgi:uncharacterized BrkB/YihY/UPF0761 family membrane protein
MSDGVEQKHSGVGIVSFVISLVAGFLMVVVIGMAGVLSAHHAPGTRHNPAQAIVGLGMFALLGLDLVAVALGIAALCQAQRNKLFGILGLVFSGVTILGTFGLMVLGLMMIHARMPAIQN